MLGKLSELFFAGLMLALAGQAAAQSTLMELRQSFYIPNDPLYLPQNPYSAAKEKLGKALFFDPRLSGTNTMSCATCHNPSLGWSDGLPKGRGFKGKELTRKTPSLINLAWTSQLMWDGSLLFLEGQVLTPIGKKDEMHMDLAKLPAKIEAIAGYRAMFAEAWPGEPITNDLIAKSIAIFERTIVSKKSRFDSWLHGKETLNDSEKRGLLVFARKANCMSCHASWRFTDESFQDLGMKSKDRGRGTVLPTEKHQQFAFRTPGLRDLARRAPYMHDGSLATLREVIDFYDRGGDVKRPSLSSSVRKLNLTEDEKVDLEAFLLSLTSEEPPVDLPILPH